MKYIIYCRKSTDTEDKQVLSLDSQENELLSIASKHNLNVVKTFKESRTAKEAGRPVFAQMIEMISLGKADAILCWKLDRLARNFIDGGLIIDSLQKSVIKEIRTYEAIHLPSETVFLLAMQFGMANQYSRDLSVNVKRGNREKLSRGEWPSKAPFGYLNDVATKKIVLDPNRAKYVVRIFELYTTGSYGLNEISDKLYEEGLRTKTGRKVFKSNVHRILSNCFYAGIMKGDGKAFVGNHPSLITQDIFEQAQYVLSGKARPRKKNLFFPLRGKLTCDNCGCILTASIKKGHHYYYCTNGKQVCNEHKSYMREIKAYELLSSVFESIHFDEELIEITYEASRQKLAHTDNYAEEALKTLEKRLEGLQKKGVRLLDTYLAEQVTKEVYDVKVLEIQNDRTVLNKEINELKERDLKGILTLEPTKKVFLEASRAKKEFLEADDLGKREIAEKLLWNLSIKNKTVASIKFKSPYQLLAQAPKTADISQMLGVLDEVRTSLMIASPLQFAVVRSW